MIRNIFLDLDNTLLDFHLGEQIAISKTLSELGITPTESVVRRYMEINLSLWRALERGEVSRDGVIYGRFERLFSELGADFSPVEAQKRYQELLSREHELMPGARDLLEKLRSCGKYRLYIATNGIPAVQYPRIKDSGIYEYLDGIFISYELGYPKPRKEFFDGCAEKIGDYSPAESIIVGDSLTSDILGGINAGMITCHYNRWGDKYDGIIPDYTINNLSELLEILDGINRGK